MQQISIETTQNVPIDYTVAGVADRFMAAFLDFAIVYGYILIATLVLFRFNLSFNLPYWLESIIILPCFFYHLLCEIFLEGQTIGKRQMNIKVVQSDGSQARLGNYLLRWLFRTIDILLTFGGLALLTIIINGRGQRLGDMAAGTTVISLQKSTSLADTLFLEIADDYTPTYPQVILLSDQQMESIKDLLNQARQVENNDAVWVLVKKVKSLLGIELIQHPPRQFLEVVIKDYNYLQ